ncbi:Ribonuclease G, partial [Haemophilus influenzae]
NYSGVSFIQ